MPNCIFLAGIHGVGKTSLANKLQKQYNISTVTVSDLIRKAGKVITNGEKETYNIKENQELWKYELKKMQDVTPPFLLDGHFTLLDSSKNFVKLPFSTFNDVSIVKVVLLECSPEIILKRLIQRDKSSWELSTIQHFLKIEHERAIAYTQYAKIPLYICNQPDSLMELMKFIKS